MEFPSVVFGLEEGVRRLVAPAFLVEYQASVTKSRTVI